MFENLIHTLLFAILGFYAINLTFDLYEARKSKNKIESFFNSLLLFIALFFIVNCPIFSIYNFM